MGDGNNKLFVGMLGKEVEDTDVEQMFSPFGNILECSLLRDFRNVSKGCAFITYEKYEEAVAAIQAMHGSTKMEGCKANIVVKFADSSKDKQQKYQQQYEGTEFGAGGGNEETKLFIGMIGYEMTEDKLEEMFKGFGSITDCTILKDGAGMSRGCGFIKFSRHEEGANAIKGMNGSMKLPGASSNIVVKFADTDKDRQERARQQQKAQYADCPDTKLFVGMLGSLDSVEELKDMFKPFGDIIDCTILRDSSSGRSKGCGFVRFSNPKEAYSAIRVLHGSEQLPGASAKIVVKFADNDKRNQQAGGNYNSGMGGGMGMGGGGMSNTPPNMMNMMNNPAMSSLLQQQLALAAAASSMGMGNMGGMGGGGSNMGMGGMGMGNNPMGGGGGGGGGGMSGGMGGGMGGGSSNGSNFNFGNHGPSNDYNQSYNDDPMSSYNYNQSSNQDGGSGGSLQQVLNQMGSQGGGSSQSGQGGPNPNLLQQALAQQQALIQQALVAQQFNSSAPISHSPAQEPTRPGPDGCNIFVMHLPRECNDVQLRQLFSPFGSILSANIFYDKVTKESKCFGFVSFETPQSAQSAIKAMNGFQIGGKRLKVQLKTNKKPY